MDIEVKIGQIVWEFYNKVSELFAENGKELSYDMKQYVEELLIQEYEIS